MVTAPGDPTLKYRLANHSINGNVGSSIIVTICRISKRTPHPDVYKICIHRFNVDNILSIVGPPP